MYQVTHGTLGSARNVFKTFEVPVAGKTGTAQENNDEHSLVCGLCTI